MSLNNVVFILLVFFVSLNLSCGLSLDPEDKLIKEKVVRESKEQIQSFKSFNGFGDEIVEYMVYRLVESQRLLELATRPNEWLKLNDKKPNLDTCQRLKSYVPDDENIFFSIESVNCRPNICTNKGKNPNCDLFPQYVKKTISAIDRYESHGPVGEWPRKVEYNSGKYHVALKGLQVLKSTARFNESRFLQAHFIGVDKQGFAQYDVFYEVEIDDIEQKIKGSDWNMSVHRGLQRIYMSAILHLSPETLRVVRVSQASIELQGNESPRQVERVRGTRVFTKDYLNQMKITMHTFFTDEVCSMNEEESKRCRKQKMDHPYTVDSCGLPLGDSVWRVKFEGDVGELLLPKSEYRFYTFPSDSDKILKKEDLCHKYKPAKNTVYYGLFFLK